MHDGSDGRAWPEDLGTEAVRAFLTRAVGEVAREEIELPHIVVCTDPETGAVTYSGPYADGLAALVAAEKETRFDEGADEGPSMVFGVAALLPVPTTYGD